MEDGKVAFTVGGRSLDISRAGEVIGEMALVDQSPRSATATAQSDCELLSIDRPTLMSAVQAQPAFAMAMLRAIAERLRHTTAQLG